MTAFHVINGGASIDVSVPGTFGWTRATVVGAAPCQDVALLQVSPPDLPGKMPLQNMPVGHSEAVKVHEPVRAIGYVGRLGRFVTRRGKVTMTRAPLQLDPGNGTTALYTDLVASDARLVPGQSGGPLLNDAGELIGMNVARLRHAGHTLGLSIALPMLVYSVRELLGGVSAAWVPNTGLRFDDASELRRAGLPLGVTMYDTEHAGALGGTRVLVTRVNGIRIRNTMVSWCKATLRLRGRATLTVIGRRGERPRQLSVPIG